MVPWRESSACAEVHHGALVPATLNKIKGSNINGQSAAMATTSSSHSSGSLSMSTVQQATTVTVTEKQNHFRK